jgi:hypothetical protein
MANGSEGVSRQEKEKGVFAPPSGEEPPELALLRAETAASGNFCSVRPAISFLSELKLIRGLVSATGVPLGGRGLFSGSLGGGACSGKAGGFSTAGALAGWVSTAL